MIPKKPKIKKENGYTTIEAVISCCREGFCSRTSAEITKKCMTYPEKVYLMKYKPDIGNYASEPYYCNEILGVMAIGGAYGNKIKIHVEGTDEEAKSFALKLYSGITAETDDPAKLNFDKYEKTNEKQNFIKNLLYGNVVKEIDMGESRYPLHIDEISKEIKEILSPLKDKDISLKIKYCTSKNIFPKVKVNGKGLYMTETLDLILTCLPPSQDLEGQYDRPYMDCKGTFRQKLYDGHLEMLIKTFHHNTDAVDIYKITAQGKLGAK